MDILVDVGNSRVKWGFWQDGGFVADGALAHRDPEFAAALERAWQSPAATPKRLAISCVSAEALAQSLTTLARRLWPGISVIRPKSQAHALGVQNAYPIPERLGVDRWLGLLAAKRHYPLPACIVDCGTALTVDVLDAQGKHHGGMIAPGVSLMKQALNMGTQNLPLTDSGNVALGLANDTVAAIHSGVANACLGLVLRTLQTFPEGLHVILTGGDAPLLSPALPAATFAEHLVLQGLAVVLENDL